MEMMRIGLDLAKNVFDVFVLQTRRRDGISADAD